MNNKIINNVLLANASQMGFNWIYNYKFLKDYSKDNEMLMQVPDLDLYSKAKPSYFAYKDAKLGTLSVQGEIIKWLYNDWKNDHHFSPTKYKNMLYEAFKPGGFYHGYIESYGRVLVFNMLSKEMKNDNLAPINDDQLVGFAPYIVSKALGKSNEEAFYLTSVLTDDKTYLDLYYVLDKITSKPKSEELLLNSINTLNDHLKERIKDGIIIKNTDEFLIKNDGTSCSVIKSMPIIFHLYLKHNNLNDALLENVIIGGASCDRAILLGYLFKDDKLPKTWIYI